VGLLGYILPHKFFNAKYGEPLRLVISNGNHLKRIVHFGHQQIFENATTYTCLLFLNKKPCKFFYFEKVDDLQLWRSTNKINESIIHNTEISSEEWNFVTGDAQALISRLQNNYPIFQQFAERIAQGIRTSANQIYVLNYISEENDMIIAFSKVLNSNIIIEKSIVKKFLQGKEIKQFSIIPPKQIVIVPYKIENKKALLIKEEEMKIKYPHAFSYLLKNKTFLENREKGKMKNTNWYAYIYPKNIDFMGQKKILVPDIAASASFAMDEKGEFAFTSGYGITLKDEENFSLKYILGLLNSKLLDFYLKKISTEMRGGFIRFFGQFIEKLPIRTIDLSNHTDIAYHDKVVTLVEQLLIFHKNLIQVKTEHERDLIERQIEVTKKIIDTLVYQLYGLTEKEIEIVERGL